GFLGLCRHPSGPSLGRRRAGALPDEHAAPRQRLRAAEDLAVELDDRPEPAGQSDPDLQRLPGPGRPDGLEALHTGEEAGPADLPPRAAGPTALWPRRGGTGSATARPKRHGRSPTPKRGPFPG